MRTLQEINRIYTMITSQDREMQNLGLSTFYSEGWNPECEGNTREWLIVNAISTLAQDAYNLGISDSKYMIEEIVEEIKKLI